MLKLLSEVLILMSEQFYLVFPFKESTLEVILLTRDYGDLMLHIAEFEELFFQLLSGLLEFLCLIVQLTLDLIDAGVQT